jgi:hypothetical protein
MRRLRGMQTDFPDPCVCWMAPEWMMRMPLSPRPGLRHPVYNAGCRGKRFYIVQDYEPSFSLLAENTYPMEFHAITAEKWLAQKLSAEFGMQAEFFEIGCDTSAYRLLQGVRRNGIVLYARPEAARPGFQLGLMTVSILRQSRRLYDCWPLKGA